MTYDEWVNKLVNSEDGEGAFRLDYWFDVVTGIMADWKANRESRECMREKCKLWRKNEFGPDVCRSVFKCVRQSEDQYEPVDAEK